MDTVLALVFPIISTACVSTDLLEEDTAGDIVVQAAFLTTNLVIALLSDTLDLV